MSKLARALLEAAVTIIGTLAIIVGAFSALLGLDEVLALSGIYYAIWAGIILVTHLALASKRRHYRLSIGVGAGVAVMLVHLAMFLTGNVPVDLSIVPVVLHDFGFALVGMMVLNLVHLVIFRRRNKGADAAGSTPVASERVSAPAPEALLNGDDLDELEPQAKTA